MIDALQKEMEKMKEKEQKPQDQQGQEQDPELVDLINHSESLRTQGFRSYIDALAARGLLRDGLDPAEATDVLLTLAGSDVFLNFTGERGWTVKRYIAWTTDALCLLLLRPPNSHAPSGC